MNDRPTTCRRPAARMSLLLLAVLLTLALSACGSSGGSVFSTYLDANQEQLTLPASVDDTPVRFVVEPGTPARAIGKQLQAAGLIRDDLLFEAYVRVNGLASALEAGAFILDPSMTLLEIVEILQHSEAASVTVTIPEGWRIEQIADYLAAAQIFGAGPTEAGAETAADAEITATAVAVATAEVSATTDTGTAAATEADTAATAAAEVDAYRTQALTGDLASLDPTRYPFLQERPAGASLEGYLFPDTYEVPTDGTTAADILGRQLDTFAARAVPAYAEALAAGQTTMDLHTVLTVASIVEREAVAPDERPAIAGVYLNRLANGIRLEADPTVQYAMGYQPETGQWWKTPVFLEEYGSVDSPYNTYLYDGLPPGPIANPGLDSIQAVLAPAEHDYLYFVALPDGSGKHVFAETFDEHVENVRRYQAGQ